MPRLQSNVSALVASQLPDYIRGDYITYASGNSITYSGAIYNKFINFIEAYYKFLEKETGPTEILQNAFNYNDVDKTLKTANISILSSFFKQYTPDIPRDILSNKEFFIKHARDLYKTKGSERAFAFLFRALFDEDLSVFYPRDIIIKTSDGEWIQRKFLRVTSLVGDPYQLENRQITGKTSKATAIVNLVVKEQISSITVYEVEIDKNSVYGTFIPGEIISSNGIEVTSLPVISNINVLNRGRGYTANNTITITDIAGVKAAAEISSLSDTGQIKSISIIDNGINYTNSTTINVSSPTLTANGYAVLNANVLTVTSTTSHGLTKNSNVTLYFSGNSSSALNGLTTTRLVTDVIDSKKFKVNIIANDTNSNVTISYPNEATFSANIGAIGLSNGRWKSDKGKLSGTNRIEGPTPDKTNTDPIYYQVYSYVLRSALSTAEWRNTVISSIHPAGTEVFGEVLIDSILVSNVKTTGTSEIWDYFAITADKDIPPFSADMTTYSTSRFTGFPVTADHVFVKVATL